MLRRSVSWLTSAALIISTAPAPLYAQPAAPPPGMPPGQEQPPVPLYSAAQLDAILAPIALYPDVLLTQVLMASAFPLQLIEASRWIQRDGNRNLRGPALEQALMSKNWDPSVKSLVPFPSVVALLTGNLEWLQDLGTAAVQQQADVMDSVQRLRQEAAAAGNLRTTDQCVVRQDAGYIYIEPAQPQVIYVPVYNPVVVYGTWAYPAYPPVYLPPPPGYDWGPVVGAALVFGVGIAVTVALWDLGRPRWHEHRFFVDTHRYNVINQYNITNNNYTRITTNVWQPRAVSTFRSGGLVGPTGVIGGAGARSNIQTFGAPGGRPGASGFAPNQQFRQPGAPGTAGHSGIVPPGQQFRDRGAPGTAGNSGIRPPGFDRNHSGSSGPGTGGNTQQFHPQGVPGGNTQQFHPQGVPGGNAHQFRPQGVPGGNTPQFHPQGVPGGNVQQFHPQGVPGGNVHQFRPQGVPGGNVQQFHPQGGGAPQHQQFRPQGGGEPQHQQFRPQGGEPQHQQFRPQGNLGGPAFHGGPGFHPVASSGLAPHGGGHTGFQGMGGGSHGVAQHQAPPAPREQYRRHQG